MAYFGQQPTYVPANYQAQQTVQQQVPQAVGGYIPQTPTPPQNNFVTIRSKEEALYYPVGPGNSVIFRKEDGSNIYIKTMGYSTTEAPIFEEFERVQDTTKNQNETPDFMSEIDKIWSEINALKNRQYKPKNEKRREDGDDRNAR